MAPDRMTVVTSRGVLTFDGEVVESFGHSFDRPVRAHVAMIKGVEVDDKEEAASPELAKLVDAVRAVAPNLKGS